MKTVVLLLSAALLACAQTGQQRPFTVHSLASNIQQYSQEDNEKIVKEFQGLRVSDVVDGLDAVGIMDQTWMDPGIKPGWVDNQKFTHRIYGVAVTLRLVPPQTRAPGSGLLTPDAYANWMEELGKQGFDTRYGLPRRRPTPPPAGGGGGGFAAYLKPDTILVIDSHGTRDNGFCGSANALGWYINGVRGIVTETGCRDADEMALSGLPVYQREWTRGVNQGRMLVESYNDVIVVGGVTVYPGDIIVGDGEGVVVVPRAKAMAVALAAQHEQEIDKPGRRKMYEKLGRPQDFTTQPVPGRK